MAEDYSIKTANHITDAILGAIKKRSDVTAMQKAYLDLLMVEVSHSRLILEALVACLSQDFLIRNPEKIEASDEVDKLWMIVDKMKVSVDEAFGKLLQMSEAAGMGCQ